MSNGLTLEVMAMAELARRHPDELEKLRTALKDSQHNPDAGSDSPWIPCDRFQRTLSMGSLVLTSAGERGRIIRFDRNSKRALVELEHGGGTRMLKIEFLELRRGRPRKETYAV